jgi:hypothetical protein
MIAMPKLIPASIWSALSLPIAKGDTDQVKHLVETHQLDVNAFVDSGSWMPVLMEALLSYGFESEDHRLPLLKYLLDKGADPNIRCRRGYNCLHIAVQQERYVKALDLFLDYKADVNVGDEDNSNVVYWAIQGWLLRKTGDDRQNPNGDSRQTREEHLRVFDKILHLGANLDQENRYGMCARKWLEGAAPDVQETVARWEASKPISTATTTQPLFPANLHYPEALYKIWNEMVPREGPAPTVQGELLRSVEKLREEAQQHANAHYRKTHKRMAVFVRDTLIGSGIFDKTEQERIRSEAGRLMKAGKPVVEDQLYDHLVDQVCVFYTKHPAPIPLGGHR